jgi:CheY-like chemotaxis protein
MTDRALIVEDDDLVRDVLSRLCKWLELEVELASDGREGLDALSRSVFTVVITDLRMPGATGLDVARMAHRLEPRPAVVVVSGFVTSDDEANISFAGAKLLRKPFDVETARAAIEAAIHGRS